jgi:hypothetical protein
MDGSIKKSRAAEHRIAEVFATELDAARGGQAIICPDMPRRGKNAVHVAGVVGDTAGWSPSR